MGCRRCGECCHLVREWVDGKIINSEPCPFLTYEEDGLATCTLYGKRNRPFVCEPYSCESSPLTPDKKWNCKGLKAELERLAND